MTNRKIAILIILAVIFLQGCVSRSIKIDPIPELKIGSPLAGIEPLTFKINEFEDIRPNKEQIGAISTGTRIELDEQKVQGIIIQAIANELRRNGHKILMPGESGNPNIVIDGIIRAFWIQHNVHMFTIKVVGTVETELTLISIQYPDKPLSKTYRGAYYFETGGISYLPKLWLDVISNAMLEMLNEFTTDEDFLKTISQARK